jgi:hypothetical protein
MKCPQCDADITEQEKCSKCGFHVADNRKELEVEYKDFKTSELLEIRQKRHTAPSGAETKIFREPPGGKAIKREISAKPSLEDKKSSFPVLAVVGLVLALIIGGFFLVRLLILQ